MKINLSDIEETALLTLYAHAWDAYSRDSILNDQSSINMAGFLNHLLLKSNKKLHRNLALGKFNKRGAVYIVIRAKKYDQYALDFIEKNPNAAIVNIGCGFDHRFQRIDNGKIEFFDIDFAEVFKLKGQIFRESSRYHQIAQSVFDYSWMEKISRSNVLFLAEGVFMYCSEKNVKSLFRKLKEKFPGSEIVCEVFNSKWLTGWRKTMLDFKMQKQLHLGKGAAFRSGIRNSQEIESWGEGIKLLEDWCYFDSNEKKIGWLRIFRNLPLFRTTQWTVHYQLGNANQ